MTETKAAARIWATAYYNQNRSEHVREWSTRGFEDRQDVEYVHADILAAAQARVAELEAALRASSNAVDDWLSVYASEMCDEARVQEAHSRIRGNGGTLHYIAQLQEATRAALNPTGEA